MAVSNIDCQTYCKKNSDDCFQQWVAEQPTLSFTPPDVRCLRDEIRSIILKLVELYSAKVEARRKVTGATSGNQLSVEEIMKLPFWRLTDLNIEQLSSKDCLLYIKHFPGYHYLLQKLVDCVVKRRQILKTMRGHVKEVAYYYKVHEHEENISSPQCYGQCIITPQLKKNWSLLLQGSNGKRGYLLDVKHVVPEGFGDDLNRRLEEACKRVMNCKMDSVSSGQYYHTLKDGETDVFFDLIKEELGMWLKQESVDVADDTLDFQWEIAYMITRRYQPQIPHFDFKKEKLIEARKDLSTDSKEYNKKLPWVAFLPVSETGMYLDVWQHEENIADYISKNGFRIFIPYGKMLVMRGDTLHGGNIDHLFDDKSVGNGCPRMHFYIYKVSKKNPRRSSGSWVRDANTNDYMPLFDMYKK
jgi:hypothetical protein